VALERFLEARNAGEADATVLAHLNAARAAYQQALELIPEDAVDEQAVAHGQLGSIYGEAGDIDRALSHHRESIRYEELQGNTYGAAQTRYNVAVHLARSGRFVDAREYALAALNGFASYGAAAADDVQDSQELLKQIDEDIARKKG
jgi:tetratricopeptide (TPR) repeat protein